MFKILREKNRLRETVFLFSISLFCFLLSLFRVFYTGSPMFIFLNWNLFLAFIPWAFTTLAIIKPKLQKSKLTIALIFLSWLLFFPNAPYILTDLFHLTHNSLMPIWFDLVLILSFAWTGLLFGFFSLLDIEFLLAKSIKRCYLTAISIVILFVGGFGIYIGRYLRWNSWDIITNHSQLIYDIGDRFINPFSHPRTWGVTLLMGLLLNLIYISFKLVRKR